MYLALHILFNGLRYIMKHSLMTSDVNTMVLLQASQIKLAGVESRLMESY